MDRVGAAALRLPTVAARTSRAGAGLLAAAERLQRAQVTRLVSRWDAGKRLVKDYRAPGHAFARRYTSADVALLADVDRAMGTMSGPATACVLRRQRDVFNLETAVDRSPPLDTPHGY